MGAHQRRQLGWEQRVHGQVVDALRGGRRAGLLAHSYRPQLVGLATRTFTGWLDVASDGTALYAPHTSKGFVAPAQEAAASVQRAVRQYGLWQARRQGTAGRLERLAAEKEPLHGPS